MLHRVPRALVPVLAAVFCCAVHATDHIVGPSGSGAPFTSIQAAINAAQNGDRVIVQAGQYTGSLTINGKSIEVIGAGSTVTTLQAIATFPTVIPPPAAILNIPAGGRARLAGMRFTMLAALGFPPPYAMIVANCAGRVELCDLQVSGAAVPTVSTSAPQGILSILDCAHVVADHVQAVGYLLTFPLPIPGGFALANGVSGLRLDNATIWMTDFHASGKSTLHPANGSFGGDGGHGVVAVNSTLHVAKSAMRGAQSGGREPGLAGLGGAGVFAVNSTILMHGGSGNLVEGADAYEVNASGSLGLGQAGSAFSLDALSELVYGADVVLSPGSGSATLPAAPPITAVPGATVTAAPFRLPTVSIAPAYVPLGGNLTVTITGEPGFDHIRAVTLQTAPAVALPGVSGALLVDLASVLVWHVEPIGPTGTASFLVTVPMDPGLAGIQIVEQGAQALPGGISIGPPSLTTLGF
jgi:hypothetical protein